MAAFHNIVLPQVLHPRLPLHDLLERSTLVFVLVWRKQPVCGSTSLRNGLFVDMYASPNHCVQLLESTDFRVRGRVAAIARPRRVRQGEVIGFADGFIAGKQFSEAALPFLQLIVLLLVLENNSAHADYVDVAIRESFLPFAQEIGYCLSRAER